MRVEEGIVGDSGERIIGENSEKRICKEREVRGRRYKNTLYNI